MHSDHKASQIQTFLGSLSWFLTISWWQITDWMLILPCSVHTALGLSLLRSLRVTEPWTPPCAAWLNKPHTVSSNPWGSGVASDTLLYMCLHIIFTHPAVWLWFAAWPASMTALYFSTDQIASLMAWDDDTGWNFYHCCRSETASSKTAITCSLYFY